MKRLAAIATCLLGVGLGGLGCQEASPPRGEALVVVSTDLAAGDVITRLRIDLYDDAGAWLSSRDIARPSPADWPVSFSVYTDDEAIGRRVWLRLRAYPDNGTRRYEGERFTDVGVPFVVPPAPASPLRLARDGRDITPELEPHPLVTVDRLVGLSLVPGDRGRVVIALRAACAGTMPVLDATDSGPDARAPGEASTTCVDTWGVRRATPVVEVEREVLDRTAPPLPALAAPCSSDDGERACIAGGVTILGSQEQGLVPDLPSTPERTITLSTFWLDRDEVTVGRYRAALAMGFSPAALPIANEGPLLEAVDADACSWSEGDRGREQHPLTCVSWDQARDFCRFAGGDLPTEAQWEYAARRGVAVGRSRYPWGDDAPDCQRAVHGRWPLGGTAGVCEELGRVPPPIRTAPGDLTPDGVHDLAGSVQEWVVDRYARYDSSCWGRAGSIDPRCDDPSLSFRGIRGGSWPSPPTFLPGSVRTGVEPAGQAPFIGFRCAYNQPGAVP